MNWLIRFVLDNDILHVSKNYTGQSKNKINPLRFCYYAEAWIFGFYVLEMVFSTAISRVLYRRIIFRVGFKKYLQTCALIDLYKKLVAFGLQNIFKAKNPYG